MYSVYNSTIKTFPKSGNSGIRHPRRDREVLDYIFSQQDAGASIQKAAANLKIPHYDVRRIFNRLTKAGEIFRDGKVYKSTAWFMQFDPRPIAERLHKELEQDLFGPEPTPKVRAFLTEFAAGIRLNLDVDESFHLAQRELMKPNPQGVRA